MRQRGKIAGSGARLRRVLREHPRACVALLALLALLALWCGAAVYTTVRVADGATISGIEVGGRSARQAQALLTRQGASLVAEEVTLHAGQASVAVVPAQVGVSVDAPASVRRLTGFTLNPVTIVRRLRGPQVAAVVSVDREALATALHSHADSLSQGTRNASVRLDGVTPVLEPGAIGTGVDVDASVARLAQAWPLGRSDIDLVEGQTQPAVTDAAAQKVIDEVLSPLLSAPVTLTAAGTSAAQAADQAGYGDGVALSPEQVASAVRISSDATRLDVAVDGETIRQLALGTFGATLESAAQDSSFTVPADGSGQPVFVPAAAGRQVDAAALGTAVLKVASAPADGRTVTLPLSDVAPAHGEDEAALGVREVVGEFATPYFVDAARNQNLKAGTAAINGTVVRAGETFSLTDALGPVDAEHGFVASGVINNGVHTNAMGGGLSQVATTTFNAAFEAGMDDVEHHPHSFWFTRYPAGREATLWTGHLDVKWKNSTPYAAVVQAWLADMQVHVRIWSTRYYTVSITSGERTNVVPAKVLESSAAGCTSYGAGQAGFSITVTRTRTDPQGAALDDDVLTTTYQPDNGRRCVAPPSPTPATPTEDEAAAASGSAPQ